MFKRNFHKIANTVIRVNNKEVATLKIVYNNNNDLNFHICDSTTGRHNKIKLKLNDYISSTISDTNQELNVNVKQISKPLHSFNVPLKSHLLEKFKIKNDKNIKVIRYDDPRVYTF